MANSKWKAEGKYLLDPEEQTIGIIDVDRIAGVVALLNGEFRQFHGWVTVEEQGPGLNDKVYVEYQNAGGRRVRKEMGYGNSGCLKAVEHFDKLVGKPVQLLPTIKGCYRVFTSHELS